MNTPGAFLVYLVTHNETGRKYVGAVWGKNQTVQGRWIRHVAAARRGEKYALERAITKHGPCAFSIQIIDSAASRKELAEKERFHIKATGALYSGYNSCAGGKFPGAETFTNAMQKLARDARWLSINKANGKARRRRMVGRTFGKLFVESENGTNNSGHVRYRCRCTCGRIVTVVGYTLGVNQKSCGRVGCRTYPKGVRRNRKSNKTIAKASRTRYTGFGKEEHMSEPSKISAAAKTLSKAENKLNKLTEKAAVSVANAVKKAEARNATKVVEATAAVAAAKSALAALLQ